VIYVPLLMITHITAFYFLLRPQQNPSRGVAGARAAPQTT
jgi:hypothetical protein